MEKSGNCKLKPYVKMYKKNGKIGDNETEEYELHQYKGPILTNDIDINPIQDSEGEGGAREAPISFPLNFYKRLD